MFGPKYEIALRSVRRYMGIAEARMNAAVAADRTSRVVEVKSLSMIVSGMQLAAGWQGKTCLVSGIQAFMRAWNSLHHYLEQEPKVPLKKYT